MIEAILSMLVEFRLFHEDDEKFPEEEVVKKATVKNDKATVELLLQENWEAMIKDDHDNPFSLNESLELYWEVNYNNKYKTELPKDDDNYLLVGQNNKTLYIKTPAPNHNLPEFISNDGDPMLLMEFAKDFVKGKVKKKILSVATEQANKSIKQIAFTKLKKGYMVDNNGKIYTGKRLIYEYKKMYSNTGELFENVEKGKNFTYNHGNGINTTKGISQYDYFSKNGKRVKFLGLVKNIGKVFDVFNLIKNNDKDLDTSEPLPLDFGPLSLIFDLAGVLVQQQKAEDDLWLEETVQLEIDEAKLLGLEATRKAINTWNHNENLNWQLMAISNETANKLLQGKFDTFYELESFENSLEFPNTSKVSVLYRIVDNENKEKEVFVIETIFINE
ncbi:hypothetical protein [Bizionia paragorgiae]|uniref:hypothetical protein n=1 Tax=Bizionia paragorgiae TaxID=283786 RepID=UPI003A91FC5C